MSDGTKFKTKGSGKQIGKWRNNFRNNNQPIKNTESHTSNIEELETATYIVRQFYIANWYKKLTEDIIRYVIRKLTGGVHLAHGMRNGKLLNMSMDTKPKKYKKPVGTSAMDNDE